MTIGLPVWNGERYLAEAIDSLLEQDYSDFALVVSDTASTDGTADICRGFADDHRFGYVRHERNPGAAWNFNWLVGASRSELFKWAADDDLYEPTFVSSCVAALDAHPEAVLATSLVTEIDADGHVLRHHGARAHAPGDLPEHRFRHVLDRRDCQDMFGVIRRHALEDTPLLGPYAGSDGVLLAHLALQGETYEVPRPLFLHRQHEGRSVRTHRAPYGPGSMNAWFDRSRTAGVALPRWRRMREQARAVHRSSLPLDGRRRAYAALASSMVENRRRLGRDLLDATAALVGRRVA